MNKTVFRLFTLPCVVACLLAVFACNEREVYYNEVSETPLALDFSTTQTVALNFDYDNTVKDFIVVFDLYTEYPFNPDGTLRQDLAPIGSGINVVGTSKLTRVIPAYVTELYARSSTLFVPQLSYAKIENGTASFKQVDINVSIDQAAMSRAGNAGSFWKKPIGHYLKTAADFYPDKTDDHYQYDLIAPDYQQTIPTEITKAISNAFPEGKIVDSKYYKDATIKVQKAKEGQTGAEVFVSVLHSGASFSNALSYFVYDGDKELEELPKAEVEALEVINIFQYADVYTNSLSTSKKNIKGLTPGKYVQLKYRNKAGELVNEFPVGAQIGWILHPDGFKKSDFSVVDASYQVRVYSVSYWNDANNKTTVDGVLTNNYNTFFSATDDEGNVFNCFGFEDQSKFASDGDCNDVVFHVLTNPADAITPPATITEEDVETTETKKGVIAFEDNWPRRGDYDLNDVVVQYTSDITYVYKAMYGVRVGDVTVKSIEDRFSFIHTGASYSNSFAYKMDVPATAVKSIKVTNERTGAETDYTRKITTNGNGFILDLCANVKDVIPAMQTVTDPQDYTVVVEFNENAVKQDDFAALCAPYNPFICPRMDRTVEVHLPLYLPTGRANLDLFGTDDDRSDKNTLWYVSGDNNKFPFAIHLANANDDFVIPVENQKIYVTYPEYTDWVESGMTEHLDWYKKPKE